MVKHLHKKLSLSPNLRHKQYVIQSYFHINILQKIKVVNVIEEFTILSESEECHVLCRIFFCYFSDKSKRQRGYQAGFFTSIPFELEEGHLRDNREKWWSLAAQVLPHQAGRRLNIRMGSKTKKILRLRFLRWILNQPFAIFWSTKTLNMKYYFWLDSEIKLN